MMRISSVKKSHRLVPQDQRFVRSEIHRQRNETRIHQQACHRRRIGSHSQFRFSEQRPAE